MSMPQEIKHVETPSGKGWTTFTVTKDREKMATLQVRNGCPPECLQTLHDQIKELMAGRVENEC